MQKIKDYQQEQNNSDLQRLEELKEFLKNVCESMCLDALETKPKDIPNYMINYLQNKYGYSSSGLQYEEKKELEKLRNDVEIFRDMDEHTYYAELQKQVKKEVKVNDKKSKNPPKPKPRLPPDELIVSDEEDYNDMDEIDQNLDNVEYIQKCNLNNRRIALTENVINDEEDTGQIKTHKKSNELIEFMRINLIKSPIFCQLPQEILKQCIDAMEEKNIPAVTDVCKQGEIGESFFFVEEGELECKMQFTKITKEGNRKKVEKFEPKLVKIYGRGDYFGELSLLFHIPRRGTVKAVNDAKLYFLNRSTFKKILKRANEDKIARKINIFKKVPILETLTDEELIKLDDISKEAIYHNGEIIIKENEISNVMFFIDKGKCIGTQTEENGKIPVKTKDYREGDIIGERSLLKGEKRQENIIANSDYVKLICLDRFSFKNNFGSLEQILMRNMDLYNTFFPPIQEEKPEEKIEDNKPETDKINPLLVSQNQNPNPYQQPQNIEPGKQNEINIQNQNNLNKQNNLEEITKKIKKEAEEDKKKMIIEHEEELARIKEQLEFFKTQNEQLMKINQENQNKINQLNEQNPNQNPENNIDNNNLENNNINNNINNNNDENNINNNLMENNLLVEEQNKNQEGNEADILKANQENPQNINDEEEKNKSNLESKNSSKLELIRDILSYKEGDYEIKQENGNIPQEEENNINNLPKEESENPITNIVGNAEENKDGDGAFIES